MADDDDIEALLREIDAMNNASPASSGKEAVPAKKGKEAAESQDESKRSARVTWMLLAGAGSGIIGAVLGTFLWVFPGVSPLATGLGAALGGAITALIGGAPKWLRD
ncbi:MAG: hypothetical protein K0U64_06700 [Actinomycetia bacterium]|nr:hypothetical protein [Actinomycetes bacterium]